MAVSKRFPLPPGDLYGHPHPWNSTIRPMLLHDLFAGQAQKSPQAPLVDFLGRVFTYRDLYTSACRFAAGLTARGIAKGDRVGLFLPNVPHYVAAYYGILKLGATVVNFSPLYSVEELAAQVEDSGTRLLFTISASALLPTALKVLEQSKLERLVVGSVAGALPGSKSSAIALTRFCPLMRAR